MKLTALTSLALCAAVVSAADTTTSSLDVAAALSTFYGTKTKDLNINAAESTSLASALNAIETSWEGSPMYTSAYNAIISAAPSSLQASISKSGYNVEDFTTDAWYTKSVPTAIQTAIASQLSAFDAAAVKILGTGTSSSKAAAAETGLPIMLGAMGLMGGVLAAL